MLLKLQDNQASSGEARPRKARHGHARQGRDCPRVLVDQTSIIAAALIIGFIVFITTKGELPKYLAVVGL